jgi:hypothetical protein
MKENFCFKPIKILNTFDMPKSYSDEKYFFGIDRSE